ncbi:MAG: hypothetical protein WC570_04145 [Patescibacteria group bacterium]
MDQADQKILEQLNQTAPHERECRMCHGKWRIEADDIDYLKMLMVPLPQLCPSCSRQLKTAFRNERSLYKRKCDATGKDIIAIISPDKDYRVYDKDYWFSDAWDPLDYGRDYDFSRGFFKQINELIHVVPYISLLNINPDNSDYLNHGKDNKDCYLLSQAVGNVNCLYGKFHLRNRDCVDNTNIIECQDCYWNIQGMNNNNCQYLYYAENCYNCHFSANLTGCQDCYLCTNLRNKQYYFLNKKYSQTEYKKLVENMDRLTAQKEFDQIRQEMIVKYARITNSENCTGDQISNSKNCRDCFGVDKGDNCKYVYDSPGQVDSYDCFSAGLDAELQYNCCTSGEGYHKISSFGDVGSSETFHCFVCFNCRDCFGCVGLRGKRFCVFNKQYGEKEYYKLVEKIKLAMLDRNEYGEFFPPQLSPYGYNETIAPDYFDLSKEEAQSRGYKWSDYDPQSGYDGPWHEPATIEVYHDEARARELLAGIIKCKVTGKPFRIVAPELAFYIKHHIPIPLVCPEERYRQRNKHKNPYQLWHRQCMCEGQGVMSKDQGSSNICSHEGRCSNKFETTYAPNRKEKVYCEECYQKWVV